MPGTQPTVSDANIDEFATRLAERWIADDFGDEAVVKALKNFWDSENPLTGTQHVLTYLGHAKEAGRLSSAILEWWDGFGTERRRYGAVKAAAKRFGNPVPTHAAWSAEHPELTAWRADMKTPSTTKPTVPKKASAALVPTRPAPPNGKLTPDPGVASHEMLQHVLPTVKEVMSAMNVLVGAQMMSREQAWDLVAKYAEDDQ